MAQARWQLGPGFLGWSRAVVAIDRQCAAAAEPHQRQVDAAMRPSREAISAFLTAMAEANGVDPARLVLRFAIERKGQGPEELVVELLDPPADASGPADTTPVQEAPK